LRGHRDDGALLQEGDNPSDNEDKVTLYLNVNYRRHHVQHISATRCRICWYHAVGKTF